MKKIEESKKVYQSIEIPEQLNDVVNTAIKEATKHKHSPQVWSRKVLYAAASVCIIFTLSVNSSQGFAEAVYKIPVLGSVARVITFRVYDEENEGYHITVNTPALEDSDNVELEKRINDEINSKIEKIKEDAKNRYEENKQMLIDDGTPEAEIPYFTVDVNYEIKSNTDTVLSFVIRKTESYANTYTIQTFYNIDLKTGKDITIADLLGDQYRDIITNSIKAQIQERILEHPDYMYFDFDENADDIFENLNFYINKDGDTVIEFDNGSIAPPPMGSQEFIIAK